MAFWAERGRVGAGCTESWEIQVIYAIVRNILAGGLDLQCVSREKTGVGHGFTNSTPKYRLWTRLQG